jgi:hypothetical protein
VRRAGPLLRSLYLAYVAFAAATAAIGLSVHFRRPHLVGIPTFLELLDSLAIPIAVVTSLTFVVPLAAALVLALVVFGGRRDDPMALLFAAAVLGLFVVFTGAGRAAAAEYPALSLPATGVEAGGMICLIAVVYLFPDGRFRPRWTAACAGSLIGALLLVPDLPATARLVAVTPDALAGWKVGTAAAFGVLFLATAVPAQILRYRRHSDAVARQQQRWVVFGLATVMAPGVLVVSGTALGAGAWTVWVILGMSLLSSVLPATAAVALFRYRLFELDRVVSRTVAWAALTLLLAGIYLSLVVALQALLAPVAGGSDLAVAASTLAVAALFSSARRRVQGLVDRSFYRSRYDAAAVVEDLGRTIRDEVDLDALLADVTSVVRGALRPDTVGVWLREQAGGAERHL